MSEEKKRDIRETVSILTKLDKTSVLLIKSGAEMLKARQELDRDKEETKQ